MNILNYFFLGTAFTFIIDCIMKWQKDHPKVISLLENNNWKNETRIVCTLLWPLGILIFLTTFIITIFKK